MSGVIEEISSGGSSTRHDELLQNLLAQHSDNPEAFLATIFGFLQRETQFLGQGDAQRRVATVLQSATGIAAPKASTGVKSGFFGKSPKTLAAPSRSSNPATEPAAGTAVSGAYSSSVADAAMESSKPSQPDTASSLGTGAGKHSSAAPKDASSRASSAAAAEGAEPMVEGSDNKAGPSTADDEADEGKGLKPNAGNGYDFEHYSWSQTLGDVSVNVAVPPGTKGKGCDVSITKNRLKVGLKGQPPILDGELAMDVKADDCMWNLSDGCLIEVALSKADAMRWWPNVLKNEPAVNLQKVEPENSKISDLDGDTRATVEKMMYDQKQKQMGLPTSDQQNKNAMLQKFMAAHPEMDFSNAKIS